MNQIVTDTENLRKSIQKSAQTISNRKIKNAADGWLEKYYPFLRSLLGNNQKDIDILNHLKRSSVNHRLIRKKWLSNLNSILKRIKQSKYNNSQNCFSDVSEKSNKILPDELMKKIKGVDTKIYILGTELNQNWYLKNCWNSCGILMRIILERALDRKNSNIKRKNGLKGKINYCLSSNVFGKSISEALKKLDNSTKITGDIVAHDSNLLLIEHDIELAVIPFRILLTDIF